MPLKFTLDWLKGRAQRSTQWILALIVCCWPGGASKAVADTISFSTALADEEFLQSNGSGFDNTFHFQLGVFSEVTPGNVFVPTGTNTSLWVNYWQPFDEANEANGGYNVATSGVLRSNPLNEDGTTAVDPFAADSYNFFGEKPYVWVFNNKTGDLSSEWALYTDTTWALPSSSSDSNPIVHPYTLADAGTAVFGGINDTSSETGSRTSFPETFSIQTHAVPEPSTGLLVLIAMGLAPLARKRPTRN